MNKHNYAVIMAGGVGSRFWPLSRRKYPKQFLDIFGTNQSLFQSTFERFKKVCPEENIIVVTNEDYRPIVKEQIPGIRDEQILGEPLARNTAPCIAYASHKINKRDSEAVMVVAPSDHLIKDEDRFSQHIFNCLQFAQKEDILITLGIKPTRPDTGYGYIQMIEEQQKNLFYKVKTFTEKPNPELAQYFIDSGEFLWNTGIFIWSVQSILSSFQKHLPELNDSFNNGENRLNTSREKDFIEETYSTLPMISIDYGVMEKASNVFVLPADFQWSDIGTWNALFEFLQRDENENAFKGKQIFSRKTKNCLVNVNNDKLVALNHVNNLIIVEADNILLVADKRQEQDIRQVVNEIRARYGERYT